MQLDEVDIWPGNLRKGTTKFSNKLRRTRQLRLCGVILEPDVRLFREAFLILIKAGIREGPLSGRLAHAETLGHRGEPHAIVSAAVGLGNVLRIGAECTKRH